MPTYRVVFRLEDGPGAAETRTVTISADSTVDAASRVVANHAGWGQRITVLTVTREREARGRRAGDGLGPRPRPAHWRRNPGLLPPFPIYLSGVRNRTTDGMVNAAEGQVPLGVLLQPLTEKYLEGGALYPWAAVDNGCFTPSGQARFDLEDYLALAVAAREVWGDELLFVTAPDVAFDWEKTLKASLPVLPKIRAALPDAHVAALVLQDGATVRNLPWDEFDALFIGGSTEWKIGDVARQITAEANRRGKWVHMGRVNSGHRLAIAQSMGVGSADGTYLLHATELAIAVVAVSAVIRAERRDVERETRALENLRSPSPNDRRLAALFLERTHPLAARLAAARLADKTSAYSTVGEAAMRRVAELRKERLEDVREAATRLGEIVAVDDILGWLREGHRRAFPPGETPAEQAWSRYARERGGW